MKLYKPDYVTGEEVDVKDITSFDHAGKNKIKMKLKNRKEIEWSCDNNDNMDRLFKYLNETILFTNLINK